MSKANAPIAITILGKEYKIICDPEEREALVRSAQALDLQMRKIKDTGKIMSTDTIAVLAALNMVQDVGVKQEMPGEDVDSRLQYLREKIERVLDH